MTSRTNRPGWLAIARRHGRLQRFLNIAQVIGLGIFLLGVAMFLSVSASTGWCIATTAIGLAAFALARICLRQVDDLEKLFGRTLRKHGRS